MDIFNLVSSVLHLSICGQDIYILALFDFILNGFVYFALVKVPHTAVAIGVTHCEVAPSHVLYAANASLVGLCFLPEKVTSRGGPVVLSHAPLCPCVGFGEW